MGQNVHTNIKNEEELKAILNNLNSMSTYSNFIIEKHYAGKEYRVYVVGNKVVGAIHRIPANITGDGINNIRTLISMKNKERKNKPLLTEKTDKNRL